MSDQMKACPFVDNPVIPERTGPDYEQNPAYRLGAWMAAALDDPSVCDAMKKDIRDWFEAGQPCHPTPPRWTPIEEAGEWDGDMKVHAMEWSEGDGGYQWKRICDINHARSIASAWKSAPFPLRFFVYPAPPEFNPSDYEVAK